MRKLKLQMQISVDGYVAGPNGELDWVTWNLDEKLLNFINALTDRPKIVFSKMVKSIGV